VALVSSDSPRTLVRVHARHETYADPAAAGLQDTDLRSGKRRESWPLLADGFKRSAPVQQTVHRLRRRREAADYTLGLDSALDGKIAKTD